MGRAAARAIREILAYNYELRSEIRQLARHLDSGNALDISGLTDAFLLSRLCILFDNLTHLRKTSAGHYMLISKGSTVTSFVAPFLEETPSSLASYAAASAQQDHAAITTTAFAGGTAPEEGKQGSNPKREFADNVPTAFENAVAKGDRRTSVQYSPAGPAMLPMHPAADIEHPGRQKMSPANDEQQEEDNDNDKSPPQPTRRVIGPAMPPPEVLEAAAAIPVPIDDDFPTAGRSNHAFEDEEDFIVGPPPPEYLEETDAASMNDRSREVARVMEVLKLHEADGLQLAAPATTGAAPAPHPPDAYLVLDVDPSASVGEIKKHYWKLSLLIHPDKCDHPQAADAFQAVASAAQALQDSNGRAAVDKRREETELRKFTQEFAVQQERERQWRIAQGKATAEDLSGPLPIPGAPESRQTWMTDLPEVRGPSAGPPKGHQTAFSSKAPVERGDTSGWTMTPQERVAAAASGRSIEGGGIGAIGPAAGPGMLMQVGADGGKAAHTAAAVDAYTSTIRGKSLLEQHLEKQGEKGKKGKQSKSEGGKKRKKDKGGANEKDQDQDDWDRSAHPWRPFDREQDLEIKPSGAADPKEMLKNMKGLSSRFAGSSGRGGGASGSRSFL